MSAGGLRFALNPDAVGDVAGLRLSGNGLNWLRRVTSREVRTVAAKLAEARPKDGQPAADFADFYAKLERRYCFLQDILRAVDSARVDL